MNKSMSDTPELPDYFSMVLAHDGSLTVHVNPWPLILLVVTICIIWFIVRWLLGKALPNFEIDSADFGFGEQKVTLRPNTIDQQIAYSIWVELSTRKIGLQINVEDDVILEIYESWYAFFGVTRELIKDIPVKKVRGDSTGKIVALSIEVLNEGLRPHLTKWQARFRRWYEKKLSKQEDGNPQDLQKEFPEYGALVKDLMEVNCRLMAYRKRMYELVLAK
jgi:hypothetical protein